MPSFDVAGSKGWAPMAGTAANVELLPDGAVVVRCGVSEIGVGITTVLAQVAAEELGIELDRIDVIFGDSLISPKAGPSNASRQGYTAGNAVYLACRKLKQRTGQWNPYRILAGALLFGGVNALQLRLQAQGSVIPVQFMLMLPYILTILVLLTMAREGRTPGALARPYRREERV